MTKRQSFAVVMTMLAETYRQTVTDAMLDGYWLVLEELSETELKAAARKAMATQTFMPAPAELLRYARPVVKPETGALIAWQAVRKAIDKYDWNVGTIDFGPLVNATIRNLGGWDTLCRATIPELDNPGWLRKRFEEVYQAFAGTEPTALRGEPLEGKLPPNYVNPSHPMVAIDGHPVTPRLNANGTGAAGGIAAAIRELADEKTR